MNKFQMLQPMLVLGLCVGLQATAFAQTDDAPRREVVSYGDLDLSHPAGQRTLDKRIAAAADRVCGPEPDRFSSALSDDYERCIQRAERLAVETVVSQEQARTGVKFAANTPRQ